MTMTAIRLHVLVVAATLIVLVLLNTLVNSAALYSSILPQQPRAATVSASCCPNCKNTTLQHAPRDGLVVQPASSFTSKRTRILYVVDVRTTPHWQQETIRKRLEGASIFFIFLTSSSSSIAEPLHFVILESDTLVVAAAAEKADEYAMWTQVHQRIQSKISPEWIIQIHADTFVDLDGTAQHLGASSSSDLSERTQATVLGCPQCLATHIDQSSSSTATLRPHGNSTLRFQQFRSWTPLVFNHAASSALASKQNKQEVVVSTIDMPDFISDRSRNHCHYQNETSYRIRKCHTWAAVQRMEPSSSLVTNTIPVPTPTALTMHAHHTTVVTAFFPLNAKHAVNHYHIWMQTMLSIQEPVIVFVPASEIERIKSCRQHAANRTLIIPMELTAVPLANLFPVAFWENQLEIDGEKKVHKDYHVFWMWLSKTWWIQEAIRLNPFQSDIFLWSDIGSFRFNTDDRYKHNYVIRYPKLVPRHALLQMAHQPMIVNANLWLHTKRKRFFFHSGSQAVAYHDTWIEYHRELQVTLHMFIKRGYFVGEDQILMQHTCIRTSPLCLYVNAEEVDDENYFGLKHVLHFGGDHQYLLPPTLANVTYSVDANQQIVIANATSSKEGPGAPTRKISKL